MGQNLDDDKVLKIQTQTALLRKLYSGEMGKPNIMIMHSEYLSPNSIKIIAKEISLGTYEEYTFTYYDDTNWEINKVDTHLVRHFIFLFGCSEEEIVDWSLWDDNTIFIKLNDGEEYVFYWTSDDRWWIQTKAFYVEDIKRDVEQQVKASKINYRTMSSSRERYKNG